jgi:hypothetical protein
MSDPVSIVRDVFVAAGWEAVETPTEDGVAFQVEIEDDIPLICAVGLVDTEDQHFVLFFDFENEAPPERHNEVARALTLANFGLPAGRFEMDYGTGLVRFANGLDYTDTELQGELIRNMIVNAIEVLDHYAYGIDDVITGEQTADEAITD